VASVFISYAHHDEKLKKHLLVHLGALKRKGLISVWHDRSSLAKETRKERIAVGEAKHFKKPVRLAKFTKREDVEIYQPTSSIARAG
jgi:hypothetical protein